MSWTTGIIGIVLAVIGMSSSAILPGRKMRREQIPHGPVIFGVVVGIIGMFLVPVVGLFLGFALGLLVAEYVRRRDLAAAWRSSVEALKSLGLGMLLEFAFCLARGLRFRRRDVPALQRLRPAPGRPGGDGR
ncbi:DUF456 domain-containing protein [Corynebacterium suedekumii]|nr:DUF456 domain-containing protein [Corynebacterium suedekumii]